MAEIRDPRTDLLDRSSEAGRGRQAAENQIDDLIKAVQKDRTRSAELARIDIKSLSGPQQEALAKLIAQQLRGQIPGQLSKALVAGTVGAELLEQLTQRLANSGSQDPNSRSGQAPSSEAARQMATDKAVPQQALRWTQFVQKAQHIPGAQTQGRSGVASPKGEGTVLLELLGSAIMASGGPGLRSPKLVERGLKDLSPAQRELLMTATFGEELAGELLRLGIKDPLQFVRAGAMPDARFDLARDLNMPRARLLGLLMRAELLKIGNGRNGELGIRPELLGPLRHAGIGMLGTLASLRGLSREEMAKIYKMLRDAAGGFARAVRGGRAPVKRDLMHWAKTASRRPSEILLSSAEQRGPTLERGDAQDMIQAWYTENLLWEKLALARKQQEDLQQAHQRVQRDEREQRERQRQQDREQESETDEPDWVDDPYPALEYDEQRMDNLICFWITDYGTNPTQGGGLRRMYVCVDPVSGAIIPQSIEQEIASIQ